MCLKFNYSSTDLPNSFVWKVNLLQHTSFQLLEVIKEHYNSSKKENTLQLNKDLYSNLPASPEDLQAIIITDSRIELSWSSPRAIDVVKDYIIEKDNVNIAQISSDTSSYLVNGLYSETLYNFRIYAIDADGNSSRPSENLEVTTLATSNIILFEDFEKCETVENNFTIVNELGKLNWECREKLGENDSQGYLLDATHNEQVSKLNWLITTQKIQFINYEIEKLSFWTSAREGNTKLELLYSSTYNGKGNPSNFLWHEISNISIPIHPEGDDSLFIYEAKTVDISEITGEVFIAFKYEVPKNQNATRWTIDNFMITGEKLISNYNLSNKNLEVILYPNPSKNAKVFLKFNLSGPKIIEIYDLSGKLILNTKTHQKTYSKDVSQLSKGQYLVKVIQGENSVVKRLILK